MEADDVLSKPQVILKFSKLVGLDSTKLKFEWKPDTYTNPSVFSDDVGRRMLSTLRASSGIMLEKMSTNIDIDSEAEKWCVEFGDEIGRHMERAVRAAMPDYEYMKARRMKA